MASPVTPVPPLPPSPDGEKPKPRLGLAILIGVLSFLFLASLAAAGYFYWQNQQLKQLTISTLPPLSGGTSSLSEPTPTPDPTAAWQIYTNSKLGFSFRYPQDFTLQQDDLQDSLDHIPSPGKNFLNLKNAQCNLSLMINPDGFGPFFPNHALTVAYSDEKGLYVTDTIPNTENLTPDKHQIIVSGQNLTESINGVFLNIICDKTSASQINSLLPQILSTFRFSDPSKASGEGG